MNLAPVAELLQARTGLDPDTLGAGALSGAVAARMQTLGLTDVAAYAARAAGAADEFAALVDAVVVAETWFFRGGPVFAFLAGRVRDHPRSPVRLLSVPCSTGEEPYSLAIALAEAGVPPGRWSIDAIDLSGRSLEQARHGRYGRASFRETPEALRGRYFRPAGDAWEIDPVVRGAVRFRPGNLLDPKLLEGEGPFDVILCRNLLIYLHAAARAQAIARFDRLLAADGVLGVGHAEALGELVRHFAPTGPDGLFLYRRRGERVTAPRPGPALPAAPAAPAATAPVRPRPAPVAPPVVPPAPVAPPDLLARARAAADAGDLATALSFCMAHLEAVTPSADAYCLLGIIRQARGESGEALACFRKALYLAPGHAEALLHLRLLHEAGGDHGAADRLRRRLDRGGDGGDA